MNSQLKKITTSLIFFPLLVISSCEEDEKFGACEMKTTYSGSVEYTCYENQPEGGCESGSNVSTSFSEGTTCAELGYSYKVQGIWSASPATNPFSTPGANGNWANSGNSGNTGSGSYDYTFTCSGTGQSYTVPIPIGSCESEYKEYARVFGCNDVAKMYDACVGLNTCTGQDVSICDSYK